MKTRGIALLSSIPCRELPSHKSQLVTQLLFGETYEVITQEGEWVQITTDLDHYTCWIALNQFQEMQSTVDFIVNKEWNASILFDNLEIAIPIGALIPPLNSTWNIGNHKIENTKIHSITIPFEEAEIIRISRLFLQTPYLWGGRTAAGIDCSGFSQLIYRLFDQFIPRDAYQQAEKGEIVSFLEEVQPGDLAFFDNEEGKITHVGICLALGKIIHASGFVKIDQLDHQGIYAFDHQSYSHKLRIIKRL